MPKVYTHYDNLKVARDAPIEVIHAAYRALAAKYHPDRNLDNPEEATRITGIINKSYVVLCNPIRRLDHDRWIAEMESPPQEPPVPPPPRPRATFAKRFFGKYSLRVVVVLFAVGILAVGFLTFYESLSPTPAPQPLPTAQPITAAKPSGSGESANSGNTQVPEPAPPLASEPVQTLSVEPKTYTAVPVAPEIRTLVPRYVRDALAPNGEPWPTESGYLDGYEQRNTGGLSTITLDNRRSGFDALIGIYDHLSDQPVRVLFVLAGDEFPVSGLLPADYDVRYKDLDSGGMSRSEPLDFRELGDPNFVQWHNSRITLYKVVNPKRAIQFERIGPEEFIKPLPRQ